MKRNSMNEEKAVDQEEVQRREALLNTIQEVFQGKVCFKQQNIYQKQDNLEFFEDSDEEIDADSLI